MSRPKILIVEDDPITHTTFSLGLDNLWNIHGVHSLKAMREYLATGAKPDAILLDLGLPDSKRETTMGAVQSLTPNIPVVVISGSDEGAATILDGAQDFLLKGNLAFEEIFRVVMHAIERHKVRGEYKPARDSLKILKEIVDKKLEGSGDHVPLPPSNDE